ncbi:MAG: hypothetical protein ACK41O_05615 [Runella zeae]
MKNQTFIISFKKGDFENDYRVQAPNRSSARIKFKERFEGCKILKITEEKSQVEQVLSEAVVEGTIKVGVQKSLQLGYSDLPLFKEDNQLKLF